MLRVNNASRYAISRTKLDMNSTAAEANITVNIPVNVAVFLALEHDVHHTHDPHDVKDLRRQIWIQGGVHTSAGLGLY